MPAVSGSVSTCWRRALLADDTTGSGGHPPGSACRHEDLRAGDERSGCRKLVSPLALTLREPE